MLKGQALVETDKYVTGTKFVTNYNVLQHLSGKAHAIGTEIDNLESSLLGPVPDEQSTLPNTSSSASATVAGHSSENYINELT